MDRTEQLAEIETRLVYKNAELKRVPLVTTGRFVVKSGPIMQLVENKSKTKLSMLQSAGRIDTRTIFLYLFRFEVRTKRLKRAFCD